MFGIVDTFRFITFLNHISLVQCTCIVHWSVLAKHQIKFSSRVKHLIKLQWRYFWLFRSTTFVLTISGFGILQVDNSSKHSWTQDIGDTADITLVWFPNWLESRVGRGTWLTSHPQHIPEHKISTAQLTSHPLNTLLTSNYIEYTIPALLESSCTALPHSSY